MNMINEDLPSISQATGDYFAKDKFERYTVRGLFYRINYSFAGKYLIETKNPVLKEYLEKEITKKESIAAELKQSIKEIESEELSGKERGNIAKRQRRYQEIQKEIRDIRKAIG